MAVSPRHSVSVAAVVVDEYDRALLIRRPDNGHWEPPGGVLELDEDIAHGLRREAAEETGLQVEPSALTGVYKNMSRGIVALVFRCRQTGESSLRPVRLPRSAGPPGPRSPTWPTRPTPSGCSTPWTSLPRPPSARTTASDSSSPLEMLCLLITMI